MIIIKDLQGRFGNRILYYNNLVQISKKINTEWNSIPYKEYDFLQIKNDLTNINTSHIMDFNEILNNQDYVRSNDVILKNCLGEYFFEYNYPTREIFTPNTNTLEDDFYNVGIHFRGGDFHNWNPESILDYQYYINSIESIHEENNKYYLFTDDVTLESYKKVIKYFNDKKLNYSFGIATFGEYHFIEDYNQLCECDLIISSPSTFSICAGFMGKDKLSIHSEKWVNSRCEKNDKFWLGVKNGGNLNYKIDKLI